MDGASVRLMSLVGNIVRAYRAPAKTFGVQMVRAGEERILLFIFLFSFLSFVSRLPELMLINMNTGGETPLFARVAAMFVASVFMAPLMMYLLAALSHLVMRLFGGRGTWRLARLALAWAALVSAPLVLISGILKVFVPGPLFMVVTLLTAVVFLWQWAISLRAAEFPPESTP